MDSGENFARSGGGEREFQYALGRKLSAFLCVSRNNLHEQTGIDGRILGQAHLQEVSFAIDLSDTEPLTIEAQRGSVDQVFDGFDKRAVTVDELCADGASRWRG